MRIIFEDLQRYATYECSFGFGETPRLTIGPMTVELHTGRITLTPDCKEAAEFITLAFSIGILYVLTHGRHAPLAANRGQSVHDFRTMKTLPSGSAASKAKASGKRYYGFPKEKMKKNHHYIRMNAFRFKQIFC